MKSMKSIGYRVLPLLLAVITGAALLSACGTDSEKPKGEAVNRVYPEGEGKYYDGVSAADISAGTTVAESTAQQETTTKKAKTQETTAPKTTKPKTTQPAAVQPTTINANVPDDNITGANINPNIGAIQGRMVAEIEALAVKSISLSESSLNVTVGETKKLEIRFDPVDAAIKTCSLGTTNGNAKATVSGKTVTVTGVNAGTCSLIVTSHNGHKATCQITVKRADIEITDDTVLPHTELCNAENAARWAEAVAAKLESNGMTRNTSLRGGGISVRTDSNKSDMSYNAAQQLFVEQAETGVSGEIGGAWDQYTFNCAAESVDGGEFAIVITVVRNGE